MIPDLSVVVPTYKRPDLLEQCLVRLADGAQTGMRVVGAPGDSPQKAPTYEVIVTDDSPDASFNAELRERFPDFRWVEGPRQGPGSNRNNGARHARAEWIVFTDDDCEPVSGWLSAFVEKMDESPLLEGRTVADRPKLRHDEESPINETGGFLWSCNMALQRELFERLGGFDEGFPFAAMEDVDLRVRLEKEGIRPIFCPGAKIVHPWRPRKGARFCRQHVKSVAYYVRKHPERLRQFLPPMQARILARTFLNTWHDASRSCGARGLGRHLFLQLYYALLVFSEFTIQRNHRSAGH